MILQLRGEKVLYTSYTHNIGGAAAVEPQANVGGGQVFFVEPVGEQLHPRAGDTHCGCHWAPSKSIVAYIVKK
ncbi:hypothetical protein A3757_16850 [Oleiphilus sp. HI0117]|nr:hypothetical protein A3732_16730 [Oleiphilus sp. HI0050]KZZ34885.1 hypothetical protein A3757_16850 [Oleiphilus sp. HI0117]